MARDLNELDISYCNAGIQSCGTSCGKFFHKDSLVKSWKEIKHQAEQRQKTLVLASCLLFMSLVYRERSPTMSLTQEGIHEAEGVISEQELHRVHRKELPLMLTAALLFWTIVHLLNRQIVDWWMPSYKNWKPQEQINAVEYITGVGHALIATVFGVFAWTLWPLGTCSFRSKEHELVVLGILNTLAFLFLDAFVVVFSSVYMKAYPMDWPMIFHHVLLSGMFLFALVKDVALWFVLALLINEFSSIFYGFIKLHAMNKRTKPGWAARDIQLKFLFGFTFLISRIVPIPYVIYLFVNAWQTGECDLLRDNDAAVFITVGVLHYMLNLFWFSKMVHIAMKSSPSHPASNDEASPLIAAEHRDSLLSVGSGRGSLLESIPEEKVAATP